MQICPLYIFGNKATDGTKPYLSIGFQGLAAWFRAKSTTLIYYQATTCFKPSRFLEKKSGLFKTKSGKMQQKVLFNLFYQTSKHPPIPNEQLAQLEAKRLLGNLGIEFHEIFVMWNINLSNPNLLENRLPKCIWDILIEKMETPKFPKCDIWGFWHFLSKKKTKQKAPHFLVLA